MRLSILPVGFFNVDEAVFTGAEQMTGRRLKGPVYSYLLRTKDSLILFDTGCSHQCRTDPRSLLGDEGLDALLPQLTPDDHIEAQLKALNLTPSAIDLVVNSHCHFDHAGGNEAFKSSTFGMQEAEYQAALTDSDTYPDPAFRPAPSARLTLYSGDTELCPGATLISTPGHTAGHQSLLVELSDRSVLITSDAVYRRIHFSPDNVGASKDRVQARASVERLMALAQDGARPFFSHDPDQVREEGWKLAPDYYA